MLIHREPTTIQLLAQAYDVIGREVQVAPPTLPGTSHTTYWSMCHRPVTVRTHEMVFQKGQKEMRGWEKKRVLKEL